MYYSTKVNISYVETNNDDAENVSDRIFKLENDFTYFIENNLSISSELSAIFSHPNGRALKDLKFNIRFNYYLDRSMR